MGSSCANDATLPPGDPNLLVTSGYFDATLEAFYEQLVYILFLFCYIFLFLFQGSLYERSRWNIWN